MILISDIQKEVADLYGLKPSKLREPDHIGTRYPDYVRPRQVAMYLARKLCADGKQRQFGRASLLTLGREFNRDHSTIIHGCRVIERLMQSDTEERRAVGEVGLMFLRESNDD